MFALELCEQNVTVIVGVHCPPKESGCVRNYARLSLGPVLSSPLGPTELPLALWASRKPGFELEETGRKKSEKSTPRSRVKGYTPIAQHTLAVGRCQET